MSNSTQNTEYGNKKSHLRIPLILFLISLILAIFSLVTVKQTFIHDQIGLIASAPVYFWISVSLMLTCTVFSLRQPKIKAGETLIMIMVMSATLSWILPQTCTLPIRADSYDWMQLVNMTLSSGTTDNPNQYMRWPIFWIFVAEFATVTKASVPNLFRVLPTVFSLLAPLYFYLVSKELLRSIKQSLYASLLFALITAQIHLSPALLGWLLLLLSVYLLVNSSDTRSHKFLSLFFILALTLTMEHHLSAFILGVLAVGFAVGSYLVRRARFSVQSRIYSTKLAMFLLSSWIMWMSFASVNFLAMPFRSLLSLGSVTWPSNPMTSGLQLSTIHVASGLVFRGILYSVGLAGFVDAIIRKRRIIEIAIWLLIMLTAMLVSQLVLGGQYPFEPLRFEFFAFFPFLLLGGSFIYSMHTKFKSMLGLLIIVIILECLIISNQIYRGTEVYTQQFFLQDQSTSIWISSNTIQPVVLITDYRLKSFLSYMISNSDINNILGRDDILELFKGQNISSIQYSISKMRPPYQKLVIYLVVDNIQTHLSYTYMPHSNKAINKFNRIPSLNKIYSNGKLVIYSNETY